MAGTSRRNWLVLAFVAFIGALLVPAQDTLAQLERKPGAIAGVVTTDDGRPVEKAMVELVTPWGRVIARTATDAEGKFKWDRVRPGRYVVRAGKREVGRGAARVAVESGKVTGVRIVLKKV